MEVRRIRRKQQFILIFVFVEVGRKLFFIIIFVEVGKLLVGRKLLIIIIFVGVEKLMWLRPFAEMCFYYFHLI